MDISWVLAGLSGVLIIIGYFFYAKGIRQSRINPSIGSWIIWAGNGALEALTYIQMSEDWTKNILPFTCSIACIVTCLYIVKTVEKKEAITLIDWISIGLGTGVLAVWTITESPTTAHILAMVALVISYIPVFCHVWQIPESERPLPWTLWVLADITGAVVVVLDWNGWEELVYSVTYGVCGIGVISIASFRTAKE